MSNVAPLQVSQAPPVVIRYTVATVLTGLPSKHEENTYIYDMKNLARKTYIRMYVTTYESTIISLIRIWQSKVFL